MNRQDKIDAIRKSIETEMQIVNACDTCTPEQQRAAQRAQSLGDELKRLQERACEF